MEIEIELSQGFFLSASKEKKNLFRWLSEGGLSSWMAGHLSFGTVVVVISTCSSYILCMEQPDRVSVWQNIYNFELVSRMCCTIRVATGGGGGVCACEHRTGINIIHSHRPSVVIFD